MKTFMARQKQAGMFSVRLKSSAGRLSIENFAALHELAVKFGAEYVHLTSRQEISIPYVKKEDFDAIKAFCEENNLQISPVGTIFKIVTACQGNETCPAGIINSQKVAKTLDEAHGGRELPCKITCSVTGCPNNCMKVNFNDIGIAGAVKPQFIGENCIFCGTCAKICPVNAIEVNRAEKSWKIDRKKCINCGRCVKICRKSALNAKIGYKIYFGGENFLPIVHDEEIVYEIVDEAVNYFANHAKNRERLKKMFERLGIDDFKAKISVWS